MQISGFSAARQSLDTLLSDDQKSTLEDILSNYDPAAMTRDDAAQLRKDMRDAGIPRSWEALQMMREAGFTKTASQEAGNGRMTEFGQTRRGELWDLYDQLKSGTITEAEFQARVRNTTAVSGSLLELIS